MATTPVFLPGKFHGQRSLAGYSPWGGQESDVTERLALSLSGNHGDFCLGTTSCLRSGLLAASPGRARRTQPRGAHTPLGTDADR